MSEFQITSIAGKYKSRKRIGRGNGSGHGKTSGRGHNGQRSRAGARRISLHEGGQMPLFRRLPKRGFSNFKFATNYDIVNVSQLERFDEGAMVGLEQMAAARLIDDVSKKVKILGDGELTKKLEVEAHKFSRGAEQKIAASGGTVKLLR